VRWLRTALSTLALCCALAACALSRTSTEPATGASASGSGVLASDGAPVLSTAAVPGLAVTTRPLTVALLVADAPVSGLGTRLVQDGYVGGRERTFQGPSKDLTHVVSRSLLFSAPAGAADFVQVVHDHAATYFGVGTDVVPLTAPAGHGWLFRPQACACHLANPLLLGVLQDGAHVVWLGIDGPLATDSRLTALLAPDLSTTT